MSAIVTILDWIAAIPLIVRFGIGGIAFGTAIRWRILPTHLIDLALIALALNQMTIGMIVWSAVLISLRHVPLFACDIAQLADIDSYDGLTRYLWYLLLPAAIPHDVLMSNSAAQRPNAPAQAVHVSVPGTADTNAVLPSDRDITKDGWIDIMASARDEKGKFVFSGNTIFKAIGGHRATVMARVKQIQSGVPPADFRQPDGSTAPADYPVTNEGSTNAE